MKYKLVAIFLILLATASLAMAQSESGNNEVLVLEIEAPVTQTMVDYFTRGIQAAEDQNVTAVLIIMDTPGGSIDSMLNIVQLFRTAEVPIIVYIGPNGAQAASAGSVITAAAHAAAMAPETVIGAASPINGDGSDINETAYRKAVEDLKATMRSLTERRGEEAVTLAEEMIEDARAVSSNEALEVGFIDIIATDTDDVLAQLDGFEVVLNEEPLTLNIADAQQTVLGLSFIEQLLIVLANPILLGILLTIGVQAILIELGNPGGWVAGVVGIVALALALYGAGQLPVNWFGFGLIILAFVLFVMEVNTPTYGALSIVGTIMLIAGLLVLFNARGAPDFARLSIPSAIAIGGSSAAFFLFLAGKAVASMRKPVQTGQEALTGQVALVRTSLKATTDGAPYMGQILVNGELWRAIADGPILQGERVEVTAVDGFTLHVKKYDND